MSSQVTAHGRTAQCALAASAVRPAAASSSTAATAATAVPRGSHYFLQAHRAQANTPAYIDVVHSADAASKRALVSAQPQQRGLLLPHMDDLDEEIQALGYEKAMVAGASAGVVEHVFMFPVDTIKTRMQALQTADGPRYKNVVDAMLRITREEGVRRLYRGFPITVAGAIPSHALHFATYENLRHRFGGSEPGHHPLINGMAGGLATMVHDAIVTPADVVKQRLQVYNSAYGGVSQCIRQVFAQEGLRAFYASYPTTVAMNVPFQAVNFAAYESFKIFFTAEDEEHGVLEEVTAGGVAGALAGFVSTPFDVVKTRLQTQQVQPGQHRLTAMEMVRLISEADGTRGFMRGATARMLYFIPSAAICWTTYETMKRILKDAW